MSAVKEIENAVRRLSREELAAFRAWFAEYDAALWDREIEEDAAAGRLDALADEAVRDLREGLFGPVKLVKSGSPPQRPALSFAGLQLHE